VDALGVLPIFMNLTEGLDRATIRRMVSRSVITAMGVAVFFMAIGRLLLRLLGITIADFMIAGGALLFVISLSDIVGVEKRRRHIDPDSVGIVPLAVPLIVGPAVLTTILLLVDQQGVAPTVSAAIVNILAAGLIFQGANSIHRVLGDAGTKATSKLASLLLAAIAVMMMRKGIMAFVTNG
jgi:multiple antibiotic resistance protein